MGNKPNTQDPLRPGLAFALVAKRLLDAYRAEDYHRTRKDLIMDLVCALEALVEVLENPEGHGREFTHVGGLGYCGRQGGGGCGAVDTADDGSVVCLRHHERGCLPLKTDWER